MSIAEDVKKLEEVQQLALLLLEPPPPPHRHQRCHIAVLAKSGNEVEPACHYNFNLFTISANSGGVRASCFASNFGASVAVCAFFVDVVPKKLLVYSSKFYHIFEESNGFGWKYETELQHDWSTLIANKNAP